MVARQEAGAAPAEFRAVVGAMTAAALRPELVCEQMPAPQRIAPYATALSADVVVDDTDLGTGRIIVLHDPAGNDAWDGTFRCVAYARCEIEPDLAVDPMLADVGWTWLIDALGHQGASYGSPSGTVTRVSTTSFGAMADDEGDAQIEIRASWTPLAIASHLDGTRLDDSRTDGSRTDASPLDITPHVAAWGELLCTAAGLEPVPDGVAMLPTRRGGRGAGLR